MKIPLLAYLATMLPAFAWGNYSSEQLFELSLEELMQVEISTASRVLEPRQKATSSVMVITAEEIHRLGARSIQDALRQIPGYLAGRDGFGGNQISFRGVRTVRSEKLLFMLDGHLVNDVRYGSAFFQFLDRLPVENVKQIEVVYGPGSALYGANAFLGVINIITDSGDDMSGTRLSAFSEFESSGAIATHGNLQYGRQWDADHSLNLNLHMEDNDGVHLFTPADAFGWPGSADTGQRLQDLQLKWQQGDFKLHGHYYQRQAGDFFGGLGVINHQSKQRVQQGFLEGEYRFRSDTFWQTELKLYTDLQDTDNAYVFLPAGSIPAGHPLSAWNSTGFIGRLLANESIYGAELNLFQTDSSGPHSLNGGLSWRRERLYNPRTFSNANPGFLPSVQETTDSYNWIESGARNILSGYLQDRYDINDRLRLTLGARYDHYSDFGSTFNPRLGLGWQAGEQLIFRLSHGRAFRAPDFYSQLLQNNPLYLSNPDLGPETIRTTELAAEWLPSAQWHIHGTWFHSKLEHLIDVPPGEMQFQNLEELVVDGTEWRINYWPMEQWRWTASYSYTYSRFENGDAMADVPRHSGSLISQLQLRPALDWDVDLVWSGPSPRGDADIRGNLPGYAVVNTTVNYVPGPRWEISGSLYNLFDRHYHWPSPIDSLPGDYPTPGRSVGIRLTFSLR